MTSAEQLIHSLFDDFSELRPLLTQHLADNDGELLPYLLLSDVARWAGPAVEKDRARVAELMQWLEARFTDGDVNVENLIAVGFVEMLPATPTGDPLLELLGPSMRQVAEEMNLFELWDPGS